MSNSKRNILRGAASVAICGGFLGVVAAFYVGYLLAGTSPSTYQPIDD